MVDQITDTPRVTRSGASPVITLNVHETLAKLAARAFERSCAIHDGLVVRDYDSVDSSTSGGAALRRRFTKIVVTAATADPINVKTTILRTFTESSFGRGGRC